MAGVLDRLIAAVSPETALRRERARAALQLTRTYEAATTSRRTEHWHRLGTDSNAVIGPALSMVRAKARHLVRNNPYAESALETISTHIVGPYGIGTRFASKRAADAWKRWADSTDCDADGVNDVAGLQDLAIRTIAESGEVIIRRRRRRVGNGLAVPVQVQILEPDYLDTSKSGTLPNGAGRIVHGVEFDMIGRRVAYWMFRDHPGASTRTSSLVGASVRVPASEISHAFKSTRAGQARAISWFAPVLLKLSDFDEFDDATLMKQKIAACLAVFTRDVEGPDSPIGKGPRDDSTDPLADTLEPGMITRLQPGEDIEVVQPPATNEYAAFAKAQLQAIATGLGVTYEDLTGDYTGLPFSAARMSRMRHQRKVERWQWRIAVPRVCVPIWQWFAEAAVLSGVLGEGDTAAPTWITPPLPMLDPDKEVAANRRAVRSGQKTQQMALREQGLDPAEVLAEMVEWNRMIDAAGVVLDSDPRNMSEAGQRHSATAAASSDAPKGDGTDAGATAKGDGEDDETDTTAAEESTPAEATGADA